MIFPIILNIYTAKISITLPHLNVLTTNIVNISERHWPTGQGVGFRNHGSGNVAGSNPSHVN